MTARLLWTSARTHRDGETEQLIRVALVHAWRQLGSGTVLVHGAAEGGDTIAAQWWTTGGLQVEPHPADWATCGPDCPPGHRKSNRRGEYCPTAGHRRNQAMVDLGADLCIAMPRGVSRGTYDCARRAYVAGIPVWPPYVVERILETTQ